MIGAYCPGLLDGNALHRLGHCFGAWTWDEALSSASPGSEATISVLNAEGGLTFEITIAGRHPEGRLQRMRDRIEALDGRLTVDDRIDASARLQGWLPLPR